MNNLGSVSYVTHVAGAMAGLTTGLGLLQGLTGHENYTRVARLVALLVCVSVALLLTTRVFVTSVLVKHSGWTAVDQ